MLTRGGGLMFVNYIAEAAISDVKSHTYLWNMYADSSSSDTGPCQANRRSKSKQ